MRLPERRGSALNGQRMRAVNCARDRQMCSVERAGQEWTPEVAACGPECVKTPSRTLAMISEDFIAGIAHEALYPR